MKLEHAETVAQLAKEHERLWSQIQAFKASTRVTVTAVDRPLEATTVTLHPVPEAVRAAVLMELRLQLDRVEAKLGSLGVTIDAEG